MKARKYAVQITGETPLLMHQDNFLWDEKVKEWLKVPENKALSTPGDDRTPAWKWIGCLYHEGGKVVLPSDNIMTMLREGGTRCPTGKKQETFKRYTQTGLVVDQSAWPILVNGKEIPVEPIKALVADGKEFLEHEKVAQSLGFELFCKRVKNPGSSSKHIRVRPRFDQWACGGTITVFDDIISTEVLERILFYGGAYAGLCDWRSSSPKAPGAFGKFTATVKEI